MRHQTFHIALIVAAVTVVAPGPGTAQTTDSADSADSADTTDSEPFTRRYIDAQARRSHRVLLRDWPELTRLLTWSRRLETAVTVEDETLSADLVEEFRARVDTLASQPVPEFLAARSDSVKATFASIRSRLDRAGEALEAEGRSSRGGAGAQRVGSGAHPGDRRDLRHGPVGHRRGRPGHLAEGQDRGWGDGKLRRPGGARAGRSRPSRPPGPQDAPDGRQWIPIQ